MSLSVEDIISFILKHRPHLRREVVESMIRRKVKELGGLVTEEGAAYIVAKELGVDVETGDSAFVEIELDEVVEGMRTAVLSGVVEKIEARRGSIVLRVVDRKGRPFMVKIKNRNVEIKEGDIIRVSGRLLTKKKYVEVIVDEKGSIVVNPSSLRRGEFIKRRRIEGVVVKLVRKYFLKGYYCAVVVVKNSSDEYMVLKILSPVMHRLEMLGDGLLIEVEGAREVGRGWYLCHIDEVSLRGRVDTIDENYRRPLVPSELKPGLRMIDVIGTIVYVGRLTKVMVRGDREVDVRDLVIEDKGSAAKVRLWGRAAHKIEKDNLGIKVVITNVDVKADGKGVRIVSTSFTDIVKA